MTEDPRGGRRKSPALATFLSFLWPGLGQWYAGAIRNAVLFALPVLLVVLVVVIQVRDGITSLALSLLNPTTALTFLALIGLMALWRLISMADAMLSTGRGRAWRRPGTLAVFGGLALVVVLAHSAVASFAWSAYNAGTEIFVTADPGPDQSPLPTVSLPPGETAATSAPRPTPEGEDERVTVLLAGIDSSPTRTTALTDTLIVASLDPATGKVTMVSFPRDIARFPLSDGRTFTGKINSLMSYAQRHPEEFADGGMATLTRELGYILGIPIHYYAAVDLAGFARMIDRVGGVTIDNKTAINDPGYGGWTDGRPVGFRLSKGEHTLDGQEALAYARSRKTTSDFARARRQQQILVALQKKLTDPAMLSNLPAILADAGKSIRTDYPSDQLSEIVDLAMRADDDNIKRIVLDNPYSRRASPASAGGIYYLKMDMDEVARLSVELFGEDSRYYEPPAAPAGASPAAP